MKPFLLLSIFALYSLPVYAHDNPTGMTLKQRCTLNPTTDKQIQDGSWCNGFLYGAIAFNQAIPAGVTVAQLELVLTKYMDEHPEKLNLPAEDVVTTAVAGAWGRRQ